MRLAPRASADRAKNKTPGVPFARFVVAAEESAVSHAGVVVGSAHRQEAQCPSRLSKH
jgi:hypothetical protein